MISVLLQSEWPWQPNDTNTFFIYLYVSLYQESVFFKKKTLPTCFVLSARTAKLLFFIFSFMVHASLATILTYLNSTDEGPGPKYLETEFTNMARQHFCSLPSFCIEHSLLFTFSYRNFVFVIHLSWHILTARDDARDRDANSSRQMTSLDAIFCRGNKSSSRSLSRFCHRKQKTSTARASRSWKKIELEL